jgi:hypothetical protein
VKLVLLERIPTKLPSVLVLMDSSKMRKNFVLNVTMLVLSVSEKQIIVLNVLKEIILLLPLHADVLTDFTKIPTLNYVLLVIEDVVLAVISKYVLLVQKN